MIEIIISIVAGLLVGAIVGYGLYIYIKRMVKVWAQEEAQEIIEKAKEEAELIMLDIKEREQEIESELWAKVEKQFEATEEKIEEIKASNLELEKKHLALTTQRWTVIKAEQSATDIYSNKVNEASKKFDAKKAQLAQLKDQIIQKLEEKFNFNKAQIKEDLTQEIIKETELRSAKAAQSLEEYTKEQSEPIAKKLLDTSIDRFLRPYCPERNISMVAFNSVEDKRSFANNPLNLKAVLDASGCEIFLHEEGLVIGVIGYDPVRRELVRRILEKMVKDRRNFNPQSIGRIGDLCKKELFKNIKFDGDQLAKELGQVDLHPEIKQMMGSLRYRYSFTQNQYFHCAEVGWLAGILSSEIQGESIKKCRRSGLLHDLGKTMDHAMDGGHAVIGADFIQARGESPEVVHAVKAHHFDEQPTTNMAFLVIAADAISGARPGARRSTIESYAQKLSELETIMKSFEGVEDAYVLSGGREVRVTVNSRTVSDLQALELSKKIADKFELEANYPGQIKVVVVRSTYVSEALHQK